MTALYIIGSILLLLILIMLIRVDVFAQYTDALRLTLKILFVRIKLIDPEKEKKPKKKKEKKQEPEKKKEPKEEKKEKPKKKSFLSKLKDKKGITGILSLLSSLSKIAGGLFKGLFSRIVIHRFDFGLAFKGEDAAATAVTYGRLCAVIYPCVNIITSATKTKDYNVTVEPVFDDERKTEVYVDVYAHIRVGPALWEVLKAGVKLLWVRITL